ncbi:PSD1 and planctomycete cytochrome C domain-containing protein [Kamptonema cortianum]|nr:PSD1 and planctomycete cytochrome C domain-containing protein [Geitlerinema splendidum]MDK3157677.1 PSD1 and planctomycete cytochrome C domain-containing protein [Kamptonema cortianum]
MPKRQPHNRRSDLLVRTYAFGLAFLPFLVASIAPAPAQKQKTSVSFQAEIMPIFRASCLACHNEDSPAAGLSLASFESVLKGGATGPAVVAGQPSESLLLQRILGHGEKPRMPMGFKALDPEKIKLIESWIHSGAEKGEAPPPHWAYIRVERPQIPSIQSNWIRNPIDNFILARLQAENLRPSPEASRETLVRRVYLDVLGLPPTPEEAAEFLSDSKPGAYERMVDRCLESPHYGERQARMWLDYARYADTNGYEADRSRVIWPWRDYVIQSFNENKPFSEFTIEQIAGDLLPEATIDQLVATGYHRNAMYNEEGGIDKDEYRWLTLIDRVSNTGTIWLGSSIACAQCHDHKYDPFSQKEFYEFLAFWESADEPQLVLTPEAAENKANLAAEIQRIDAAMKTASDLEKESLGAKRKVLQAEHDAITVQTTLILRENPKKKPETPIRERGMYLSPGEVVAPNVPSILNPLPSSAPRNRLGLANWLVSRENPLTARVQVNRFWEQHFGIGLVKSIADFGTQGEFPIHKELLDWMAVEFMDSGWDMKHIHRLILLSATYRQKSNVSTKILEVDPENRLLARGPRFRLEAEAIRDSYLTASGLLARKVGGPSVMPSQPDGIWDSPYNGERWKESDGDDRYRRSIYTYWKRSATYPMFTTFDASTREICTPQRIRTNTPLQALNMLNDSAVMEACLAMARSVAERDPESQITTLFSRSLVRKPTKSELKELLALQNQMRVLYSRNPQATRELTNSDDAKLAALTIVANIIFNLDEFLSLE